ncbi:MAG: MupG family TIM beta-alpha barrel fold protein [Bifidobacteriaceae bacterium]|jgi:hypothetical protein|nr:MupG family TIM beta-alpha barrel fold protein [Bifidobacteriaceae bacterium]
MPKLGISVYPEHASLDDNKKYIDKAAKSGFSRIFTCLLSVEGRTPEEIKADFTGMIDHAHKYNMEVILDVAPYVFERLGISYEDLSFFADMHADGIRLDQGFTGMEESALTFNKYGLKIEVNASAGNGYIDNVVSWKPNRSKFITCHNFYPQKYTGLSLDFFNQCNAQIQKHNLNIAAFVTSQAQNTFGPWPVAEGLCTIEMHRELPIDVQMRHYAAIGTVDDILIGNQFATDEELETMAKIDPNLLTFKIEFEKDLHPTEEKVIYEADHIVRGDLNEYSRRSTWPRITYKKEPVPPANTRDLKRGDIVVVNDNYGQYKAELHVILKPMPNAGNKNVVGHIPENELFLLDYMDSWRPFGFFR